MFCARPVARMVENVGSTGLVLGLIAMATDVEGLYAGVKALTCVVKTNRAGESPGGCEGDWQRRIHGTEGR